MSRTCINCSSFSLLNGFCKYHQVNKLNGDYCSNFHPCTPEVAVKNITTPTIVEKKFKFTGETKLDGFVILHRIEALRDFGYVKKGDKGGYLEEEGCLSHDGDCWVYDEAKVLFNARVSGDAQIFEFAKIYEFAHVFDKAEVFDGAKIYGRAQIYGEARIHGDAHVFGQANIYGRAEIAGVAKVDYDVSGFRRIT